MRSMRGHLRLAWAARAFDDFREQKGLQHASHEAVRARFDEYRASPQGQRVIKTAHGNPRASNPTP